MRSLSTRALAVVAALLTLLAAVATAPSAAAAQRHHAEGGPVAYQIVTPNGNDRWCLTTNSAGKVYVDFCTQSNTAQQWYVWNGGWTKSVYHPNSCLDAAPNGAAWMAPCGNTQTQYWRSEDGLYRSVARDKCLAGLELGRQITWDHACVHSVLTHFYLARAN